MHMADALISPLVAGTMLSATITVAAYSVKKVQLELDDKKVPLMGVMGALVFALQMINFTIPGTGSSGHIGGGILLAILLGPYAGFLTMASVLFIQALFFADGGLLAYGCNVFNLGFFTCFVAYPLLYQGLTRKVVSQRTIFIASLVSVVVALQLGAFSVALETFFSGKTEIPLTGFVLLMQSIHLAIGLIEGLVTAVVVIFVWQARPEIINQVASGSTISSIPLKKVLSGLMVIAVLAGGSLSWLASAHPDGLEWSLLKASGVTEFTVTDRIQQKAAALQGKIAILPDYGFRTSLNTPEPAAADPQAWPNVNVGTSASGLVGGALTLVLAAATGLIIKWHKHRKKRLTA